MDLPVPFIPTDPSFPSSLTSWVLTRKHCVGMGEPVVTLKGGCRDGATMSRAMMSKGGGSGRGVEDREVRRQDGGKGVGGLSKRGKRG